MRNVLLAVVMSTVLAGCAAAEDRQVEAADRTVVIQMRDTHFEPDEIDVRRGETVAFRFTNRGSLRHDAFIGDDEEQEEHERDARMADDEHGGGHAAEESNAITLEPGDRATLTHTFDEPGEILIGCHEPGHYEAGMVVTISVG